MSLNDIESILRAKNMSGSKRWGIVGEVDGKIYRVIYTPKLILKMDELKEIAGHLERIGLIKTEFLGKTGLGNYILKHERFNHQTKVHDWTFQQKKDAVIMILKLQRFLRRHGFSLHDPHINNVTFKNSRPIYFDYDSIHPDLPNVTRLAEQFWLGRKRPFQGWGIWLGVNKAMLNNLVYKYTNPEHLYTESIKMVKELQPPERKTQWSKYSQALPKGMDVDKPETHAGKYGDATQMFQRHLHGNVETVLDIGASRGIFTRCMLANGVKKAVSVDIDEGVIEQFYKETKVEDLPVTCAYFNVMDKYEPYANHRPATERFRCDLVLCIALIHHLCYFRQVSFEDLAEQLWKYTGKYLMIEWIPNTDKCLTGQMNKFGVDMPGYTEVNFMSAFKKHFKLIEVAPMTPHPRAVLLYKKRPGTSPGLNEAEGCYPN